MEGTLEEGATMEAPSVGVRRLLGPVAQALQQGDERRLGLRRTGALARGFNSPARRAIRFRRRVYDERFAELLADNGGLPARRIEMRDGFALDETRTLPHLDGVLTAGAALIEEQGGTLWQTAKPFLQDILPKSAAERHPALLDFITSSDVVGAVTPCFGYVPLLPGILPEAVRLMESSTKFDRQPDGPWRESQLYHLDYHSTPTVYVIVALRDIGPDDGPLHFLGKSASRKVAEALDYGARGVPYRLRDEDVYSIVDESEVHRFAVKAGTVLFLESSACMHFGSRRPANPRYQMQYAFASPVRNDFLELWHRRWVLPVSDSDSRLRRLLLDPSLLSLD